MARPDTATLEAIVVKVRAPIWDKPAPPPKPKGTWKGLKVGDRIESGGFVLQVEEVDSAGVSARMVIPFKTTTVRRIETDEVLAGFTKVTPPRPPRKQRPKKGDPK